MTHPRTTWNGRLLVMDQGMLKRHKDKPMHGVELFRMRLIRGLAERGARITIVAEKSWKPRIMERLGDLDGVEVVGVANLGGTVVNGTLGALMTFGDRFDVALMGDARRGLIPAMFALQAAHHADRMLVFAHRPTTAQFTDAVGSMDFDTVCVSEHVAKSFGGQTNGRVDVYYGVAGAERFYPPTAPEHTTTPRTDNRTINFCLLGKLPNVSKGHMRAIEAFNALPSEVRRRCHLHLASFADPPKNLGEGITAHGWMDADGVGAFLREMDVLLALSSNETFSQAIVQGMLTELPSIYTSLDVYVEKMDTGAGIVVNSTREIVEAMERLAGDAQLRKQMGEAGRAVALERYVWDTDVFIERFLKKSDASS